MKLIMESWRRYLDEITLEEGVDDQGIFKAIFLAGGPGSGKSYIAARTTDGAGLKVVNSDKALEHLLAASGREDLLDMTNLSAEDEATKEEFRARAKKLSGNQQAAWCQGKLGQVVDGTGDDYNKIVKLKKQYEVQGYDTYMLFVNTSLDDAKASNIERNIPSFYVGGVAKGKKVSEDEVEKRDGEYYLKGSDEKVDKKQGRAVPENVLVQSWADVQYNKEKFKELFGEENYALVQNSPNATPADLDAIWNAIMKSFLSRPLVNPKALAWIAAEKGVCEIPRPGERVGDQYARVSDRPPKPSK